MIRVASYNIRKCIGADRRRRPERTLEVLRELDADIVALQEADRRFGTRASAIPPHLLDELTDYRHVPFDIRHGSLGWHGNAILVRKRATIERCEPIHLPALEPRGAVVADIALDGAALRIVGMHLDLSGLWRRRQAHALLHHLDAMEPSRPRLLMGDLNEWRPQGGCLADFARHHRFADCGRSFPARRPIGRLDRILAGTGITIGASGVHTSAAARRASDHLPIWAEIRIEA